MSSNFAPSLHNALKKIAKVFTIADLIQALGPDAPRRGKLQIYLDFLVSYEVLRKGKKGRYTKRILPPLLHGHVRVRKNGRRSFLPATDGSEREEYFLPAAQLHEPMDGDRVFALNVTLRHERRPDVIILGIEEHGQETIVGRCNYNEKDKTCLVYAQPSEAAFVLSQVDGEDDISHLNGMIARLKISTYPTGGSAGTATLLEVLGPEGDPHVDILTAAARVGLPLHFSAEAQSEADALSSEVTAQEREGRTDLCHIPFVTIDGADAKDFDDAVALESGADGSHTLWVAIADVSHYVSVGSPLDLDAYARGTSTYFPGFCLPMLPEKLSNGICSLNPQALRLAVVLQIKCTAEGKVEKMTPHQALIRSRARLTYTQVQQVLDGNSGAEAGEQGAPPELAAMLRSFQGFARTLNRRRNARGALDFDLPEPFIGLDESSGQVTSVTRRERLEAHRIIEECMLLANECVADYLQQAQVTGIYRLHDKPELASMQQFQEFLAAFDIGFSLERDGIKPAHLRAVLRQVSDPNQAFIINRVLLRSMKQAYYAPHPGEHFALATSSYGHFTSPIRRYPDLIQHRMLRHCMERGAKVEPNPGPASMEVMAEHATSCERRSVDAEREIVSLRSCQFMQDKIDEIYSGFITGVTEFGFFVELDPFFIEGLVHIRTLGDDYYEYDPVHRTLVGQRRRRHFKIGQTLDVMVQDVRLKSREIDFILPESLQSTGGRMPHKKRRNKGRNR
ncbi:MAG: ribonuclease R [Desulfuromonadaceae bacterium]|nr:ribonuclease R [Desulfuromonadaceae bacterium]